MRRAFTLIELLIVVGIIALLLAITIPALRYARDQGREIVCRSNLRQLAIILRTYSNEHDQMFPEPSYIYHSAESFDQDKWGGYPICCRWHDERMGYGSALMRDNPALRGSLWPYLGNKEILRCPVGRRANELRGCCNWCRLCEHDPTIPVVCQYTYTMNTYLGSVITTVACDGAPQGARVDSRSLRKVAVRRESQVTRSPAEVFAFAEKNSWAVNTEGIQPGLRGPHWPADYNLSGKCPFNEGWRGTLRLPKLEVFTTYAIEGRILSESSKRIGDAFATYHRPKGGDLNTGYSFAAMLDGHVEKITVADQLRRSRRVPGLGKSHLGPGGNLALAWPLDVPPPGGWENQ